MSTRDFFIADLALAEIKRRLSKSDARSPVAALAEASDSYTPPEAFMALLAGGKTQEELKAAARAEFERIQPNLKLHLTVLIYDENENPLPDIVEVDGIRLSLPSATLDLVRGCHLDYLQGRFVLRKGKHVFHDLRSLGGSHAAT